MTKWIFAILIFAASPVWGAQLVCISDKTKRDVNDIGDVVAILPDSHQLSPRELEIFTVYKVKGTPDEVRKSLEDAIQADGTLREFEQSTKYRYRVTTDATKTITIEVKSTELSVEATK